MPGERQPAILSVNTGSSTLKYAFYPVRGGVVEPASGSGVLEGLETGERAFQRALAQLVSHIESPAASLRLEAVAHRVVHGGELFRKATLADDRVIEALARYNPLAPLHQPHNLEGIRRLKQHWPGVPQIACFDTAFHAPMPEREYRFALPEALFLQGVRRYGFHGLSYRHVVDTLDTLRGRPTGRALLAHLGSGASLCAVRDGQSQASTMGFTALDGLMMGTRSGALDPGVVLFLLQEGWDPGRIERLLYRESGLLGVSGLSADLRVLRGSRDPAAARAIDLFSARLVREAGGMAAVLGGLDLIAFTGGIGEHDADLRQEVAGRLRYLGVHLDEDKNRAARGGAEAAIHAPGSAVEVWVVPADEGRAAAREAWSLLASGGRGDPVA
ncbi:MAG: acetate/propionate family kinase [Betaproteobacteria bacterium]|nr:acetate/propionate family kinase [Betaproteobacteria bacterium]